MEMERFHGRAKAEEQGALVLDLAKAFDRVSLLVVWAWATHLSFPRKILRVLCGLFRAPEAGTVRGMCGRAARDHHGYPAKVQVELLAFTHCIAGCIEESHKKYPPSKLRDFVDDVTALVKGRNKEVAEMATKVTEKLKEEVEKKGLKLLVTENGKEGKSKMIASCGFVEKELSQFSKEEGVTLADSVESLGVDLRTRVKRLGVNEKARRKKCKVRLSLVKKNKTFQKN